ncbi:MAG TPA: M1 family metallopeptidase [Flavisolibacter sp.]|nr:M1 family metallopeptidase [Flavisolibacter sp.]
MMKAFLCLLFSTTCYYLGAQGIDVQHYRYEIELSDASDAITGKAIITVKFLAEASQLQLDLESLEEEKGMMAFSVTEGGKPLQVVHRNDLLLVNLAQPAMPGTTRIFQVDYMGVPKDGLIISKNKFGERTFFADNWPNRAHHWLPSNDIPADKATVEFIVSAPSAYSVISNGLLVEEKNLSADRKRTHWKEDLPIPTKVMVIGVAKFAVARVDSSYRLPVTAWVYPGDSAKGFYDYALADDVLYFFESYIGPFPFKKLANVQSTTIFGGMENASAIFYGEKTVTGTRASEDLIAHEIVHQWFGNTATEKTFAHLWLSEGFATYLTNVYIENKYGRDSFVNRLASERAQVVAFAAENVNPVVDSVSPLMDLLNANSYQKGAWVLHMLRQQVGDSVFKKIIQTYYQQFKWNNADTRDFQKVAEAVCGKNLQTFFEQWLYKGGIPELQIQTKIDEDKVKVTIVQQQGDFRFPLEIAVVFEGKTNKYTVPVEGKETNFKLELKGVKSVVIDPACKLLYKEASLK